MKAIMISIQPQWVEKIFNGEKTIEIRKTRPNCELPCKVYIYCTRPKKWWRFSSWGYTSDELLHKIKDKFKMCDGLEFWAEEEDCEIVNGKVVAEFTLNTIETLWQNNKNKTATACVIDKDVFEKQTCMTWEQYREYHKCKNGKYPNSYAWHIDNLKIYDRPKELSEFKRYCNLVHEKENTQCFKPLCKNKDICNKELLTITRPPQSWCYVEEEVAEYEMQ